MEYVDNSREQDLVNGILRRFEVLKTNRAPYNRIWDMVTEFGMPTTGSLSNQSHNTPDRRNRNKFDSTLVLSIQSLSSMILSGLTNSGSRWFEARAAKEDIDDEDSVRRYLQELTDGMFHRLYSGTFEMAHTEAVPACIAYGTACLLMEKGDNGYTYRSIPIHELYIDENGDGEVDLVMREFEFSVRQLIDIFGIDNLPHDILNGNKDGGLDKRFKVLHSVIPNDEYSEGKRNSKYLKFKSCWILPERAHLLKESGYSRMPYVVFRFMKVPGQVYGSSPAIQIMSEVLTVNKMCENELRQSQMAISPAFIAQHDGLVGPLRNTPGAINYGGMLDGRPTVTPLIPPGSISSREHSDLIEQKRMLIRSAFFIDPLINRENSIRTASEVAKRSNEELVGLTPYLARLKREELLPILDAELDFEIKDRKDLQVPEALNGKLSKIEFTGPLAKTHRAQELNNLMQGLQIIQGIAQIDPSILQNLIPLKIFQRIFDLLSMPLDLAKTEEEIAIAKAQEQQMMQQQQMMQGASQLTDSMSQMAKSGLLQRGDLGLPPGEGQ